jgi:large subunit ribosomal protein L7e
MKHLPNSSELYRSDNTTPQAQKILRTLGLKELNNAVLLRSDPDIERQLIIIQDYIAFGYPTKQVVNDLIRKRGFIKKEGKRLPISDNNVIEELLGAHGIICLEDLIDSALKCSSKDSHFEEVRQILWPFQLTPLQELSDKANTKRVDNGKELKKREVKVEKGGYLGLMQESINDFVKPLI